MIKQKLNISQLKYSGNLNIILSLSGSRDIASRIFEDLKLLFKPNDISYSSLNLETSEISFKEHSFKNQNSINKWILEKGKESIVLENCRDQVLIEHLFHPLDTPIENQSGSEVIFKYFKETDKVTLVLGWELSINVASFDVSLKENLQDKSLYPILTVVKDSLGIERREYSIEESQTLKGKMLLLNEYVDPLEIT